MRLKGLPNVLDIRPSACAGIDLASQARRPGLRAYKAMEHAFHEEGVMLRSPATRSRCPRR